ncbi:Sodium/calcium exchanger protein-domain-containing protein [Xylariaceae sp. FL0804]|nr:Sodium/calcium exchanger protein-domain-containing protein [Xylariaceae sp. FL0804]
MKTTARRSRVPSSRPFYTTVFLISLLAVYSLFVRSPSYPTDEPRLVARAGEDCRLVHNARDKCAFVKLNCHDDEAGLLEYLTLYYCDLGHAQPVAFVILVLWLGLLFTTIGIAASDFFSVNLSTISTILGLSESLAGVTFLAFGNGSPDVFSTFAAMSSNSGSMAVGELIGAAGFITSVVAGSMALVREFKVGKKTFVRDICFFIAAVAFTMVFLADGDIHLWECCAMIGFYLFYVVVVVGWHAISKRRSSKRAKEAASRGHFYAPTGDAGRDELEPYRDDPDEGSSNPMGGGSPPVDIGALERGLRIDVATIGEEEEDDDEAANRHHHVAAEMASSMRVNRPRGRRSATTITPIRPSLVGALEFRSVLSSLQREGNVRMRPIHVRSQSTSYFPRQQAPNVRGNASTQTIQGPTASPSTTRNRALSSGNTPQAIDPDISPRLSTEAVLESPSHPHTVGGRLAPPPKGQSGARSSDLNLTAHDPQTSTPQLYPLHIPSAPGSEISSPAVSPFPGYTDSPGAMTPNSQHLPQLILPPPIEESESQFSPIDGHMERKPIKWWPYQLLPAPHVLMNTLFPTLQGWREKPIWDKFISIVFVPSIFLLVITLPVVESDTTEGMSEDGGAEQPTASQLGPAPSVSRVSTGSLEPEPETEWQRYRRRTRSRGSSCSPSPSPSPALNSLNTPRDTPGPVNNQTRATSAPPQIGVQTPKSPPELAQDSSTLPDEESGWNRWLLILQLFTGPLFCVFIVWANMAEDLDRPVMGLVRALLVALVCSLVLLGVVLMTTSPERRPKYHFLFCFLGFVISIAWISTVAGEVVGVLKTFGVILDISEAILGLTVFAVGNSIGDLVADITVARLGYPVMAL